VVRREIQEELISEYENSVCRMNETNEDVRGELQEVKRDKTLQGHKVSTKHLGLFKNCSRKHFRIFRKGVDMI
jgi:hypothetical protein